MSDSPANNTERAALLFRWLTSSGSHNVLGELIDRCIVQRIAMDNPGLPSEEIEDLRFEISQELLWIYSVPFELGAQYGDWWRYVVEDWLQDGWEQLFCFNENDCKTIVEEFLECMDSCRLNKDIDNAQPPGDREREEVREFLLNWQAGAFNALLNFLQTGQRP